MNIIQHPDGPLGLSVVIPVYNGGGTIGSLIEALCTLKPAGGLEVVIVNDGSSDESSSVCRALQRTANVPVTYLEHTRNFGEHNAVMTGLRCARGEYVITMDDDLQNPPHEVIALYNHARLGGWDVVYSRYNRKQHAVWRNVGSRFANTVADRLLSKPKGVYLSSFRCMSRLVAHEVTRYTGPYPHVDGLLMQVTQHVDSIAVEHLPRAQGRSNYTVRRLVRLWLALALNFSILPLRLAVFVGAAMGAAGVFGALAVITEALSGNVPSGWASTMTVMLLIGSVQCLVLGVVGEYLGRNYLTANGKPQAVLRVAIPASSVGSIAEREESLKST